MRKLISSVFAVSALLMFGVAAQASQGTAAVSQIESGRGSAVLFAQADKPADKPAAAAEKKAAKKEVKKKPERKCELTRKEMDEVRRHVPAEYHHYLPKGR